MFRFIEASDAAAALKASYAWSDLGTIEVHEFRPVLQIASRSYAVLTASRPYCFSRRFTTK